MKLIIIFCSKVFPKRYTNVVFSIYDIMIYYVVGHEIEHVFICETNSCNILIKLGYLTMTDVALEYVFYSSRIRALDLRVHLPIYLSFSVCLYPFPFSPSAPSFAVSVYHICFV